MLHRQNGAQRCRRKKMTKKAKLLCLLLFILVNNIFAMRLPSPKVEPLTKGNFTYKASISTPYGQGYCFGILIIESIEAPRYFYTIPVYSIRINHHVEADIQWVFIKSIEFKNDEIITITNERNYVFEFNINTNKVTPVNAETQNFEFDFDSFEINPILKKSNLELNEIYEDYSKRIIEDNEKYTYNGTQPKRKKLSKIEDVIKLVENALFPIHGEENIKNEEPYYIRKYKDKWLVSGTFPESMNGGGFEIVINAKTSQIESLYQTGR